MGIQMDKPTLEITYLAIGEGNETDGGICWKCEMIFMQKLHQASCGSLGAVYIEMGGWVWLYWNTGPLFTKMTPSYWYQEAYRGSHYKPETIVRPSQGYNGDSYTHKTASFP